MNIAVYPEGEQIEALGGLADDAPVVMLNMLKFKAEAESPHEGKSGRDAYMVYADAMREMVEAAGSRFLFSGTADLQVIGQSDSDFDVVALVEYPSKAAFLEVAFDPRVAEIGVHRAAGLEGQWLVACTEQRDG